MTITRSSLVRFQVLMAASMKLRFVFWDVLPCKIIVDRRLRGTCCLHHHHPDDEGSMYLWNVGRQLFYMAVHPRGQIWRSSLLTHTKLHLIQEHRRTPNSIERVWKTCPLHTVTSLATHALPNIHLTTKFDQ